MDLQTKIERLKQHALDNYEEGGHWVAETYSNDDYVEVLDENNGDLEKALKRLRYYWELLVEQERNCR
jgi:phage-related minor tail protein